MLGNVEAGGLAEDIRFLDTVRSGASAASRKSGLAQRLAVRQGDRVLEIGPGTGEDLTNLVGAAGDQGLGVGVEILPGMAVEARERSGDANVVFIVGDTQHLPLRDGAFDKVNCERVLQHVPDAGKAIEELHRVLAPEGSLLAFEPDQELRAVDHPDRTTEQVLRHRAASRFANPTIGRRLYGLLVNAGFDSIEVSGSVSHWMNPDLSDAARDAATSAAEDGLISPEVAEAYAQATASQVAEGSAFSIWVAFEALARKPSGGQTPAQTRTE